jgi:acyl carrier protein
MICENVRARVLTVVTDLAPLRNTPVTRASSLREDLGYDSLSLIELAAALEDEFGLPASAELDAEAAETVQDVEEIVLANVRDVAA